MKIPKTEELIPLLRAMVATELVTTYGLKKAEVARLLSITPQAVTQYVKGVRAGGRQTALSQQRLKEMVREFAGKIAFRQRPATETELLDLAYEVLMMLGKPSPDREALPEEAKSQALRVLRNRLAAEQEAAELFLNEAIKAKDEMVSLLFRQIASDSIRHADIVQTTISAIEKNFTGSILPDPERLQMLRQHEEKSHAQGFEAVKQLLKNDVLKILLDSIEADEAKHDMIIEKLAELSGRQLRQSAS
ncbi:MAG: hypothetical protein QW074_04600 [Candidatus Caldarchaeum sp.]